MFSTSLISTRRVNSLRSERHKFIRTPVFLWLSHSNKYVFLAFSILLCVRLLYFHHRILCIAISFHFLPPGPVHPLGTPLLATLKPSDKYSLCIYSIILYIQLPIRSTMVPEENTLAGYLFSLLRSYSIDHFLYIYIYNQLYTILHYIIYIVLCGRKVGAIAIREARARAPVTVPPRG